MDVNEAEEKLKVTEDERKAVENYFGFEHTSINILSDLDPRKFIELGKEGWLLAENKEDLKRSIEFFVDIYSLMYKDSLNQEGRSDLVRGTSQKCVRELNETTKQFLSTSKDERISKRFSKYGDDALVRIAIKKGVPCLYSEKYRTSGVNEEEVIIAPFCKVVNNKFISEWNGYKYYSVEIAKGELQEKTQEEIEDLRKQVIDGYEQNIDDMKEYVILADKIELLRERLERTSYSDIEERKYISQEINNTNKEFDAVATRTSKYKQDLNSLLQGMCREKEKEIDEAREVVQKDQEQKKREIEARKKEEQRKRGVEELSQKLAGAVEKTGDINGNVLSTYTQLLDKEGKYKKFANEVGIDFKSSVEEQLEKDVNNIVSLVGKTGQILRGVNVPEDSTIDQTIDQSQQYNEKIANVNKSAEISGELKEIVNLYNKQSIDSIKKNTYLLMNDLMKRARISLLQQKKANIQNEKKGVFDKITGKAKVRKLQLENIDLKMELESKTTPEEKEYYSVRDMLAEIYAFSQTELEGQTIPELGKIFNILRTYFRDEGGKQFSLDYIKEIAKPKIIEHNKDNLPAIPDRRFRLFGKARSQITNLQSQNAQLQNQIYGAANKNEFISKLPVKEETATSIFKQKLMDINRNFEDDKNQERNEEKIEDNIFTL